MTAKRLYMTIGLPRAGKSTWAMAQGYPIVCPDAIRLALHGERFIGKAEPMVWAMARYMVQALFIAGHNNVILDATSTTPMRRAEWKSKEWTRHFVHVTTSYAVAVERAKSTGHTHLIDNNVILRMFSEMTPVNRDELSAGETSITRDGEETI
jgi:predicted kinase